MKTILKVQPSGHYIAGCDFDAFGGIGHAQLTLQRARAKVFDSAEEAMRFWQTRSRVCPTRPDGKPNRPLTAYTVEIVALSEAPTDPEAA